MALRAIAAPSDVLVGKLTDHSACSGEAENSSIPPHRTCKMVYDIAWRQSLPPLRYEAGANLKLMCKILPCLLAVDRLEKVERIDLLSGRSAKYSSRRFSEKSSRLHM